MTIHKEHHLHNYLSKNALHLLAYKNRLTSKRQRHLVTTTEVSKP